MENYVAKKHWFFWMLPSFFALLTIWSIILPIVIFLIAYLRWKSDILEIKDGCIYSRTGVIFLDKKTIPIDKISFITEKSNILSEKIGFGMIQIQSSAYAKEITYPYIVNPSEFIQKVNEIKEKKEG